MSHFPNVNSTSHLIYIFEFWGGCRFIKKKSLLFFNMEINKPSSQITSEKPSFVLM